MCRSVLGWSWLAVVLAFSSASTGGKKSPLGVCHTLCRAQDAAEHRRCKKKAAYFPANMKEKLWWPLLFGASALKLLSSLHS